MPLVRAGSRAIPAVARGAAIREVHDAQGIGPLGGTSAFAFRGALLAAVGDGRIQQRDERAAATKRIVSNVAKPLPLPRSVRLHRKR